MSWIVPLVSRSES